MAATLRRTFRYPGEDDGADHEIRGELDEEGQISRPSYQAVSSRILKLHIAFN